MLNVKQGSVIETYTYIQEWIIAGEYEYEYSCTPDTKLLIDTYDSSLCMYMYLHEIHVHT